MKSSNKKMVIVAAVLGLVGVLAVTVMLYQKDSKTVQEAMVVRAYVVNFCMEYARYPKKEEFEKRFSKLAGNPDWLYQPGEDLKSGTFQYPMTVPVLSAPGESKFAEFTGAYAVSNPCQVFNREVF